MNSKVKAALTWLFAGLALIAMGIVALLVIEIPNMRAIRKYGSVPLGVSEAAVREILGAPIRVLETPESYAALRRFGAPSNGADGKTLVYLPILAHDPAYVVFHKDGVVRRVVVICDDTSSVLDDRQETLATQ